MANTVTQTTLYGGAASGKVVRKIHITSDGSEETDLVVYDNSALIADVSKGKVDWVMISGGLTGAVRLEWDQTTDFPICSLSQNDGFVDFRCFGGIANPNGTGATGDIVLTSFQLANLDDFTIIFQVSQY